MVRRRIVKPNTTLSLAEVERALGFKQPGLVIFEQDDVVVAKGRFAVHDGPHQDGPLRAYEILIVFPKAYPDDEPLVMETAGAIERIADRHMYKSGACCTCVWEEWLATAPDTSVKGFCEGPLYNFFLGQIIFDKTGEWPFGERAHGSDGMVEAAVAMLGREVDHAAALRYLKIVSAAAPKGHWPCPCGSQKKLRDCCADDVHALRASVNQKQAGRLHGRLLRLAKAERQAEAMLHMHAARAR